VYCDTITGCTLSVKCISSVMHIRISYIMCVWKGVVRFRARLTFWWNTFYFINFNHIYVLFLQDIYNIMICIIKRLNYPYGVWPNTGSEMKPKLVKFKNIITDQACCMLQDLWWIWMIRGLMGGRENKNSTALPHCHILQGGKSELEWWMQVTVLQNLVIHHPVAVSYCQSLSLQIS
jgi:hypothetical protein